MSGNGDCFKMRKINLRTIIVFGALVFFAVSSLAQEGPPPDRDEFAKRIELVRMWKLTEALDLDEETASRFFPILNKYESKMKQHYKKKREAEHRISEAVRERTFPEKKEILALINQIFDQDREINELRRKEVEEISHVLTNEQLVKFIHFHSEFKKRIRKMIRDIKGGKGRGRFHGPEAGGQEPPPVPDVPE